MFKDYCLIISISDLPSVTLVKKTALGEYYDYIGKVYVVRYPDSSPGIVKILDRKNEEEIGDIADEYKKEFLKYEGEVKKFRGKFDKQSGLITPHIRHEGILKRLMHLLK